MNVQLHDSLGNIDACAWNALNTDGNPFILHEFLYALETTGCLGKDHGWYPQYLSIHNDNGELIAACAAYIKTNSYGEFVFDWAWAEAYERNGLDYYPKLVISIPYTPATGPRILVRSDQDYNALAKIIEQAFREIAANNQLSGVHWLFTNERDTNLLVQSGMKPRLGCQYHWQNHNYASFDDFLNACTSKRRKTIRRERRSVQEQGLQLEVRSGDSLNEKEWELVSTLYTSTFDRKWGEASLNLDFFKTIGQTMGDKVVIVFAYAQQEVVACSVMLKSNDTLYGRYWGCFRTFKDLHFEACFYQGIEYCIAHKLKIFEPGAQGEHKITRGFVPTKTWSAHTLFHPGFSQAIDRYLKQEQDAMQEHCEELHKLLPFREEPSPKTES